MSERRLVTDEERIETRHVLQETLERVRQLRDAMDPRHGMLGLTDLQLATGIEQIVGPLIRLEQKMLRVSRNTVPGRCAAGDHRLCLVPNPDTGCPGFVPPEER